MTPERCMAGQSGKSGRGFRRMKALSAAAVGVLAIAVAVLWWVFEAGQGSSGRPGVWIDADDAALVALGREVYAAHCAACHGVDLEGEADWRVRKPDGTLPAPPHDESGHTWHHADALLFEITRSGGESVAPAGFLSGMPGFSEALSDREIAASIAFIKSRWPAEIRHRQELISRRHEVAAQAARDNPERRPGPDNSLP